MEFSWELAESILILLLAGSLAGIMAGLLGIGGGIILVPPLVFVFDLMQVSEAVIPHLAIGTSLATIIATSLSSAKAHLKRGSVDQQLLKYSLIPTSLGAGFGGFVAGSLSGGVLAMIFGFMAVVVSVRMIIPSNASNEIVHEPNRFLIGNLTGLTGIISAMVGIGGGAMNVPVMSMMGIKMHQAVGTSASRGFVIALPGPVGFSVSGWENPNLPEVSFGFIHWLAALCICLMTVILAPLGATISHRLDTKKLKQVFGIFLLIVAMRTLWRLWS
ncbi:MAG: sulfite exporter TauE/SafE family protein [Deltaproteobacteria bacterium]